MLITFVGILAYSFVSTELFYDSSLGRMRETLAVYMNAFDEDKYSALGEEEAESLSLLLGGARITFIASDGTVLADSEDIEVNENHLDRDEVVQAAEDGEGYSVRRSSTVGTDYVYYCRAYGSGDGRYFVRIALPTSSEWALYADFLPTVAIYLVIDLLACVLFTYVATYFILRPVENLTRQAALSARINTRFKELQPIAEVLNERNKDIERKMNEIKEEKELVERAQNSKNEFISNITHEMNTPLTSIRGFAELISSGNMDKAKTVKAGKTILRQSERLSAMITQILHYSAIDDDRLTPYEVNVSTLVREQLNSYVPLLKDKSLTLEEHIEDGVTVSSRRERIVEILDNLVSNAIKYNKQNGKIIVTLDARKLAVEDTGIGIAHDELPHIFSRFYTVDKSHGENVGFGLGLSIVRKICELSGWTLDVDSTPGEGTKFTIGFRK